MKETVREIKGNQEQEANKKEFIRFLALMLQKYSEKIQEIKNK